MNNYKVSAIVAGYNVEEYIVECLDSLASQTLKELEVIMVDDGSPDKTGEIMDLYSKKYDNFKVVHQTNQGLSMVRNNGIKYASGTFIAFVDGDDIVPENAYALMYKTISKSGSDIVSGGVSRTNGSKITRSFLHKKAIRDSVSNTSIFEHPELIYDTTSWNKLYRKSLLLNNHLEFPKGMLYEDMPIELSCHLLAKSVDIIEDCVYLWRRREGENTSITQQRSDMKNFVDRIRSIEMCFQAINKYVSDEKQKASLKKILEFKVMDLDLMLYINSMNSYDQNYKKEVRRIILNLIDNFDPSIVDQLASSKKLKYLLLKSDELSKLSKIANYRAITFRKQKPKRVNGKLIQDFKFILDENGKPYRIEKTGFTFNNRMESIEVDENSNLIITGHMYVSQLDCKKNSNISISMKVVNITNSKEITIPVKSKLYVPHVTRKYGVKKYTINPLSRVYNYDYSGFSLTQPLDQLREELGVGKWKFIINYTNDHVAVQGVLGQPQKLKLPRYIIDSDDNVLDFKTNHNWEFYVNHRRPEVLLSSIKLKDENSVDLKFNFKESYVSYSIFLEDIETGQVLIELREKNQTARIDETILKDLNEKQLKLVVYDKTNYIQYPIYTRLTNEMLQSDNYNIFLGDNSTLTPKIYITKDLVVVEQIAVSPNNKLSIKLSSNDVILNDSKLELKSFKNGRTYYFDNISTKKNMGEYIVPLSSGYGDYPYELGKIDFNIILKSEEYKKGPKPLLLNERLQEETLNELYKTGKNVEAKLYTTQLNFLVLTSRLLWTSLDKTPFRRKFVKKIIYPLLRLLPLSKKTMVFDSYWSTAFNCNPRAIYEYVKQNYPHYKLVWIFDNPNIEVDDRAIKVRKNSFQYFYYLATAKYFIENTNMPNLFAKRKKQIDVQTLHGTMLKTMGLDEPQFKYGSKKKQNAFLSRVANWDYLISSSDYQSNISKHAYLYDNKILDTGFPRNDALYSKLGQEEMIKLKLGIPLDKKVLLYAPTFRSRDSFAIHLDIEKMREQLSNEYVLITRFHYFVAKALDVSYGDTFIYDMSFYPTIEDLFVISDILITDYSSLMFDYAHLKRPILFYAYDLEEYVNDIRGVYLDFKEIAPGPIVKNTDKLIDAILNIQERRSKYKEKEIQFYNTFCQYGQDGNAASKVVEYILNNETPEGKSVPLIRKEIKKLFKVKSWYRNIFNRVGRFKKKDIIIFESFLARRYSDSPKAIYEYMRVNNPEFKLYWNVNKDSVSYFKENNIPHIVRFSYKGIFKMARAKYWISNTRLPLWLEKPSGTTFIQTWHGTPLKTLGLDIQTMSMGGKSKEAYRKEVIKDTSKWDYLISPNHYSTNIFQSAFAMKESQILETGYPRNDILFNYSKEDCQIIKEKLGIKDKRKIILYTPTWRDNEYSKYDQYSIKLKLDLDKLSSIYKEKAIILVRAHYLISENLDLSGYSDFVIDVSNYEDVSDLYIISDCLITDYSSTFFDYANLRRPMIFFTYDLESYADEIRGFYFDFKAKAPGPIVETNEALIQEIDKVIEDRYVFDYEPFIKEFCYLEDGKATERFVNKIFTKIK